MSEREQLFSWTGPTPTQGFAQFVQLFAYGPEQFDLVVRNEGGEYAGVQVSAAVLSDMAQSARSAGAKTLHNSDLSGARQNVPDLETFGDADAFKLICKASSAAEGWMKSTKAMEVPGVGCIVQVTTHQRNHDGTNAVAEALTFVPGATIMEQYDAPPDDGGKVVSRSLWRVALPPESTAADAGNGS